MIVLNQVHTFVTIPGELSCLYDQRLKDLGKTLGCTHVSIFGLTNDAHGYIISPESREYKTMESGLSLAGKNYGDLTEKRAETVLKTFIPKQTCKQVKTPHSSELVYFIHECRNPIVTRFLSF